MFTLGKSPKIPAPFRLGKLFTLGKSQRFSQPLSDRTRELI